MQTPLISIVVPVYNVAPYIEKCLKSIQAQSFTNFRCIVVNDGSTDNSLALARQAVRGDWRFEFIDKPNRGLSSARNAGIDKVSSPYISFLDSDDWMEPDCLKEAYRQITAEDADICLFSINYVTEEGAVLNTEHDDLEGFFEKEDTLLTFNTLSRYAWNKLYKTEVFKDIRYPEHIKTFEDVYVFFELIHSRKLTNVRKPLVNYLQRSNTLSKGISPTFIEDRAAICEHQERFAAKIALDRARPDYVRYNRLRTFIINTVVRLTVFSKDFPTDSDKLKTYLSPKDLSLANVIFAFRINRQVGMMLALYKLFPHRFPRIFRYLSRKGYLHPSRS